MLNKGVVLLVPNYEPLLTGESNPYVAGGGGNIFDYKPASIKLKITNDTLKTGTYKMLISDFGFGIRQAVHSVGVNPEIASSGLDVSFRIYGPNPDTYVVRTGLDNNGWFNIADGIISLEENVQLSDGSVFNKNDMTDIEVRFNTSVAKKICCCGGPFSDAVYCKDDVLDCSDIICIEPSVVAQPESSIGCNILLMFVILIIIVIVILSVRTLINRKKSTDNIQDDNNK